MIIEELLAKRNMTKYRLAVAAEVPHATLCRSDRSPSILIRRDPIAFFKFPAEVPRACEPGFFCNGRNRVFRGMEQFCGSCQAELYQICHRRHMDRRLENMQGTAFSDGGGGGDFFQG